MGKYVNRCWGGLLNGRAVAWASEITGISEAVAAVVFSSVVTAAVLAAPRYRLKKFHVLPYFGIAEAAFLMSVKEMAENLPVIHKRLNRALRTYVDVFKNYPDYAQEYIRQTGDGELTGGGIARYIYNLSESGEDDFLYPRMYRMIHSIRGCVDAPADTMVWVLSAAILLAALAAVMLAGNFPALVPFAFRGGMLVYSACAGKGMFMACVIVWILGVAFSRLLSLDEP